MKVFLFIFFLLLTSSLSANYSNHPKVKEFINFMVALHYFDKGELINIFAQVERKDSILKAISTPGERKPWYKYRDIFLGNTRANNGANFWKKHQYSLQEAYDIYGVPPEIILGILGVETNYGSFTGSYRIIDALTTLAFDYPRRSDFFIKELKYYLLLARDNEWDVFSRKGSYAGAMGIPQFMPSSYTYYSVDFDGDEQRDLFNNPQDIIGSVANYFYTFGWQKDQPIATPVKVTGKDYKALINETRYTNATVGDLKKAGVIGLESYQHSRKVGLVELTLEYEQKEYWAAFENFYVITEYNHSTLYGMAVYQLSEKIKKLKQ